MINFLLFYRCLKILEAKNKDLQKKNEELELRLSIIRQQLQETSSLLEFKENVLSSLNFNPHRGYEFPTITHEIIGEENLDKEELKILKSALFKQFGYLWVKIFKSANGERKFEVKYNYKDSPSIITRFDLASEKHAEFCLKEAVEALDFWLKKGAAKDA